MQRDRSLPRGSARYVRGREVAGRHRIGDLALLKLDYDLGLDPVPHYTEEPDASGGYEAWGYSKGHRVATDCQIRFGRGLTGTITTMGKAFEADEIRQLFRQQDHPSRKTQILRVTTTIQPGHSGAPIFDENGKVAAIADGGLTGGMAGLNWSIPAHIYLNDLPNSTDKPPEEVSHWAGLFSATAPSTEKAEQSIAIFGGPSTDPTYQDEPETPPGGIDPDRLPIAGSPEESREFDWTSLWGEPQIELVRNGPFLLRQVTLREAMEYVLYTKVDDSQVDVIEDALFHDGQKDEIWFDVYLQEGAYGTIAVPSFMEVDWNSEGRFVWAYSPDGVIGMSAYQRKSETGDLDGSINELHTYVNWVSQWAEWFDWAPSQFQYDTYDPASAHATFTGFFNGLDYSTGVNGNLMMSLEADAEGFTRGTVIARPAVWYEPTQEQTMNIAVAQLGVRHLNDAFRDDSWAWAFDDRHPNYLADFDAARAAQKWIFREADGVSDVSIVRQISLRQVLDTLAETEPDLPLHQLESAIWDDSLKDQIWFDIYEDRLTRDTAAVPFWPTADWNEEDGTLSASNESGTVWMSVNMAQGNDFDDALALAEQIVGNYALSENWMTSPAGFEFQEFSREDEFARFEGTYEGDDGYGPLAPGLAMGIRVSGDVLLLSAFGWSPDKPQPTQTEELEAIALYLSAHKLIDFAKF